MKRWMRVLASTVLACSMLATMLPLGAMAAADTTVSISEADVLVHGRTYEKNDALCLDWSNSGISFNFNGTGAKVQLSANSINPNPAYMNVYVDGALAPTSSFQVGAAKKEYVLAEGLSAGDHIISLRKRNEAVYGGSATVSVYGLTITEGALTAAPKMSERRIEVIGDSITAGFGNLAADTTVNYSSHVSDGTSTYATMTAQALGAEIDVIARSGIRFVRADINNSMYPAYDKVSGLENKCNDAYDFANNKKDVVIINLGTNDNGATLNGERVTDDYVQSETKEFLKLVREKNPTAKIVWAYGIMGSGRADAIQKAIKEMNDAGDQDISFYSLDSINPTLEGYGSGNHPTVTTAINRSFGLAEYISSLTGWDYHYDVELAQELRVAQGYLDAVYLKPYTEDSIQTLKDKIAAAQALTNPTNEQIQAAVKDIQTAHQNLTIAMNKVAEVAGSEPKSGTTHYMAVNFQSNADMSSALDNKWYLTYELKAEAVGVEPTDTKWYSYIRNGRAYLTNEKGQETEIAAGLSLAGYEPGEDGYAKVTVAVPDSFRESSTAVKSFRLFYYNDTEHAPESDRGGVEWPTNNSQVQISVRNVEMWATVMSFVSKDQLEAAVAAAKTDLSDYEDGEAKTAYEKALADAKAVLAKDDATQRKVNAALEALATADAALVLKSELIAVIMADERTSKEDHYLSMDQALSTPIDLTPYKNEELMISYDIRINTTENHPAPDTVGWINAIRNGRMRLFSVDASEANNENGINVGGDSNGMIHCGRDELANIQPNQWLTVTQPVPAAIMEAGRITKFHMYIYNDLNSVDPSYSNSLGVTASLKNIKITKASSDTPTVDKAELKTLLDGQKAHDDLLKLYTADSVAAYEALFTAAKAVYENANATQEQVAAQVALLKTADSKLVENPPAPVFMYGDVDGNGKVDSMDALMVLQAAADMIQLNETQTKAADVDGAAGVSSMDALVILQYATHLWDALPLAPTKPDDPTPPAPTPDAGEGLGEGDGADDVLH